VKRIIAAALTVAVVAAAALLGYSAVPRETRIASYATSLLGRNFSQRHNALLSVRRIDGSLIPPGGEFSFIRRVGSFSSDQGYRKAPVSYNGQLIDDWGGGVCQTSTTVYNSALLAGMKILERHPHRFCPSYVPPGRDAAVAYRDVDLRFRNPYSFPVRIRAIVDADVVRVDFLAPRALPHPTEVVNKVLSLTQPETFYIGRPSRSARLRNSGKAGYDVAVYRFIGRERELVSEDEYPAMNRLVQYP
jgi:vancomycin resistance protein VanW